MLTCWQFVSLLPADDDGVLSFEGYAQVLAWWKLADADKKLRRIFAILDLNDKNQLDAATLARALATVTPQASKVVQFTRNFPLSSATGRG